MQYFYCLINVKIKLIHFKNKIVTEEQNNTKFLPHFFVPLIFLAFLLLDHSAVVLAGPQGYPFCLLCAFFPCVCSFFCFFELVLLTTSDDVDDDDHFAVALRVFITCLAAALVLLLPPPFRALHKEKM